MESREETPVIDISPRQRKFGLPDWMVNNIERLNFVTDFEQYACSPPETEGFLADYKEGQDSPLLSEPYCPIVEPKAVQNIDIRKCIPPKVDVEKISPKVDVEKKSPKVEIKERSPKAIINAVDHLPALHQSCNIVKSEEMFSSPDSTPCATPEPSPVVRRKMSNPNDTVITNPGRWFYMGKMNKLQKNLKEAELRNKNNKIKCEERPMVIPARDSHLNPGNNGIKLMISDFDLNAVSPTSW